MKELKRFKGLNPLPIQFDSQDPRFKRRKDESEKILRPNNSFKLPFTVPSRQGNRDNGDVVIVVNGYNQPENSLRMYFEKRFGICQVLQRKGYSSVLLPIPFHLWRTPSEGIYGRPQYTMGHRVNADRTRFYLGYKQLILDIEHLVKRLRGEEDPKIELPFDVNRVHLMGYSLGGLATLSSFTIDRQSGNKHFSSCTVLFSGASLKYVDPRGTGISEGELQALGEFYVEGSNSFLNDKHGHLRKSEEIRSGRLRAFKYFLFGRYSKSIHATLSNEMRRVPVIIGQVDHVMQYRHVMRFIPSAARRPLIETVAGVGHFLWRDDKWIKGGARKSINKVADILDNLK